MSDVKARGARETTLKKQTIMKFRVKEKSESHTLVKMNFFLVDI